MDQFLLPGDIAVMVLRFLAASECENAVFSMIEELPMMKMYIPGIPPGMARKDYLKILSRSSFSPGLSDVLNDYAKSKFYVSEQLQKVDPCGSPSRQYFNLEGQLKKLLSLNSNVTQGNIPAASSVQTCDASTGLDSMNIDTTPVVIKETTEVGTNTDMTITGKELVPYDPKTAENQMIENVPIKLCRNVFESSIMIQSSFPQRLANTIAENIPDVSATDTGVRDKAIAIIAKAADTEMDIFMKELFSDLPDMDNSNSGLLSLPGLFSSDGPGLVPGSLDGLSNLFNSDGSLITKEDSVAPTSSNSQSDAISVADSSPEVVNNRIIMTDSSSSSSSAHNVSKNSKSQQIAKKRIVPKPAPPSTPKANPVFEQDVIVKAKMVDIANKDPPHSLKHYKFEEANKSNWEKLGRKSITPKVLLPAPSESDSNVEIKPATSSHSLSKEPVIKFSQTRKIKEPAPPTTVTTTRNKRKAKIPTPVKMTPDKAKEKDYYLARKSPEKESNNRTSSSPFKNPIVEIQSKESDDKPAAGTSTPGPSSDFSKSSPSKYESLRMPRLELVKPSPNKTPAATADENNDQKIPSPFTPASAKKPKSHQSMFTNSLKSKSELTPILEASFDTENNPLIDVGTEEQDNDLLPRSSRTRRQWASADVKIKATTTQAAAHRKSYSTPRKSERHVRSLLFKTPPSLKQMDTQDETPSPPSLSSEKLSRQRLSKSASGGCSRKRKPETSPEWRGGKSKKRLQWCDDEDEDEDGYKSSAFPDRKFSSRNKLRSPPTPPDPIVKVVITPPPAPPPIIITPPPPSLSPPKQPSPANSVPIIPPPPAPTTPLAVQPAAPTTPKSTTKTKVAPSATAPVKPLSAGFIQLSQISQHVQITRSQATPAKENSIVFNILPPPIGFPDPTPVKSAPSSFMEQSNNSNYSLITPMKSSNNSISPPMSLPPTPRYNHPGPEDSNSNFSLSGIIPYESLFPHGTIQYTPCKNGPPPTPGRNMPAGDESSSSNSQGAPVLQIIYAQPQPLTSVSKKPLQTLAPKPPPPLPASEVQAPQLPLPASKVLTPKPPHPLSPLEKFLSTPKTSPVKKESKWANSLTPKKSTSRQTSQRNRNSSNNANALIFDHRNDSGSALSAENTMTFYADNVEKTLSMSKEKIIFHETETETPSVMKKRVPNTKPVLVASQTTPNSTPSPSVNSTPVSPKKTSDLKRMFGFLKGTNINQLVTRIYKSPGDPSLTPATPAATAGRRP